MKISIRFLCGHFEALEKKEIEKEKILISPVFKINGKHRAESGLYCLKCSKRH